MVSKNAPPAPYPEPTLCHVGKPLFNRDYCRRRFYSSPDSRRRGKCAVEHQKIASIVLNDRRTPGGELRKLIAYVDDRGDLVLEGYDMGDAVEKWWGDADYEYWRRVDKGDVPQVLLELISDRFQSDSAFAEWLTEKGIPSRFDNWS